MESINIQNLGKKYHITEIPYGSVTLKEYVQDIFTFRKSAKKEFWAIRHLDFTMNRGEIVGIVGPNGSGKTTLLNIISQVTEPTEGQVTLRGRVGAILGANTGFDSDLNTVDNIYLAASIMGFSKNEINSKMDSIVSMAMLEKFAFEPIKRLSSGMRMKLGISIVIKLKPEILIFDEVVSVLDQDFRNKLYENITNKDFKDSTVIIVNHDNDYIQRNCNKVLNMKELNKNINEGNQ